ncbi:MAG: phosphoadenosine phosphosulfate reductase family protein [Thermoprotei archaeon]
MPIKKIWPKITKIYWDPDYDVPVVRPKHEQVDLFYVLRLTEPGDARPGFERDYVRLEESIKYEFGSTKLYNIFFRDRFILLNKVPHWDQMWEVVSSGNVWGQLYYDPFKSRWRFRLSYAGAYYAYFNRLADHVRISGKPRKGTRVYSSSSSNQVIVVNEYDEVIGLAERVSGNEYSIIKIFRRRIPPIDTSWKNTTMDDVLKHNEEGIEWYKERSIKFIQKLYDKYKLPVVVSYSGGKDSLVSLHLTLQAVGDATLFFNDTGLELPETLENVEFVAKKYGLELVKASAGGVFWETVWTYGPPGRDYRWCCKLAKLIPIAKATRIRWGEGALNIVGQRAYESIDRAKSPVIWRNRWVPHLVSTTPIQEWNQLVEWLYIHKYKLPYNPLYDAGYERLGCYMCPASTLAEFSEVEHRHPSLWEKWLNVLEYWRKKLDQPIEWIKYGLWRWATPANAKYRIARRIPGYKFDWRKEYIARLTSSNIGLAPIKVEKTYDGLIIVFNKQIIENNYDYSSLTSNLFAIKMYAKKENENIIIESSNTQIIINRNRVFVRPYSSAENLEDLADFLKTVYRIKGCTLCGSCALWCPFNAIRFDNRKPMTTSSCSQCRMCYEVCPLAEVLVERIVLPIITGNPKIFKRSSRRKLSDEERLLYVLKSMHK